MCRCTDSNPYKCDHTIGVSRCGCSCHINWSVEQDHEARLQRVEGTFTHVEKLIAMRDEAVDGLERLVRQVSDVDIFGQPTKRDYWEQRAKAAEADREKTASENNKLRLTELMAQIDEWGNSSQDSSFQDKTPYQAISFAKSERLKDIISSHISKMGATPLPPTDNLDARRARVFKSLYEAACEGVEKLTKERDQWQLFRDEWKARANEWKEKAESAEARAEKAETALAKLKSSGGAMGELTDESIKALMLRLGFRIIQSDEDGPVFSLGTCTCRTGWVREILTPYLRAEGHAGDEAGTHTHIWRSAGSGLQCDEPVPCCTRDCNLYLHPGDKGFDEAWAEFKAQGEKESVR